MGGPGSGRKKGSSGKGKTLAVKHVRISKLRSDVRSRKEPLSHTKNFKNSALLQQMLRSK
jgi:hypothetical protein